MRPKGVVRPLSFGSDFHKLLENRTDSSKLSDIYKDIKDTYYELPPNQQSSLGDNYLDDVFEVFEDYTQVWKGTEKPLITEHQFKIQIASYKGIPVYFVGFIDEIYEDAIGEHKTFNIKPDLSILTMNMQSMLYVKAWELESGQKLKKVKWDYIKSKPSERPIWLEKSQRFSEANSSKVTPMSWLRACNEKGIDDLEIRGKAAKYAPNIQNFFFRHEVDVVPEMVDLIWEDFLSTVKDIIRRGDINKVKNVTRDCSWCNFRPLCYGQFTGADVEHIKQSDFQKRE